MEFQDHRSKVKVTRPDFHIFHHWGIEQKVYQQKYIKSFGGICLKCSTKITFSAVKCIFGDHLEVEKFVGLSYNHFDVTVLLKLTGQC